MYLNWPSIPFSCRLQQKVLKMQRKRYFKQCWEAPVKYCTFLIYFSIWWFSLPLKTFSRYFTMYKYKALSYRIYLSGPKTNKQKKLNGGWKENRIFLGIGGPASPPLLNLHSGCFILIPTQSIGYRHLKG